MIGREGPAAEPSAVPVQRIVEMAYDLLVVLDEAGFITYVNGASRHLLGRDPAGLIGRSAVDLLHPDDVEHALVSLNHHRERIHTPRIVARLSHADGSWVPLELTATNAFDDDEIKGLVISAREAVAPARDSSESRLVQLLYALLHHVDDGVLATDTEQHITVMNRSMSRLLGLDDQATQPLRLPQGVALLPAEGTKGAPDSLLERPLRGESVSNEEWLVRRADRSRRRVVVNAQPLTDGVGTVFGSVMVFKDVTEQRRHERELLHLATHDALTGLANRRLLLERLEDALGSASDDRTTVLICDLDHFKEVNDTFGHDHGDQLLVQLTRRLQGATRPRDTLARLGGDEFVLITQAADERAAHVAAQRLVDVFRQPLHVAGHIHPMSLSVGMAIAGPGDSAELLLQHADAALYLAKERGGSRYELFESDHSLAAERRLVARELLTSSLRAGEVHLNYQPVVSLISGDLAGAEALVRLPSPDGQILLPDQFLEIAERSGLQMSLDLAVLHEAVAATMRLHERLGNRGLGLTCNVSGRQLSCEDLADQVLDCLAREGMEPSLLSLELAGHGQMEVDEPMRANLVRLREAGVRLGLDDFGAAQGTLSLLLDLPFSYVKVGRTLVRRLPGDVRTMSMLQAMVQMASAMGLEVRAEGVERHDQAMALSGFGVDLAQGFLFSPPLTERAYTDVAQEAADRFAAGDDAAVSPRIDGRAEP